MKIAIIGSGLAGLGVAYHLHQKKIGAEITFYDQNGLGGAASKVATGLLHPFPGKHGKLSLYGFEAFEQTLSMIQTVESTVDYPIADYTPIEKISIDKQMKQTRYLIEPSVTVFTPNYLQALYQYINRPTINQIEITDIAELDEYDQVVIAGGYDAIRLSIIDPDQFKWNKGQVLKASYPLTNSIIANGYIAKSQDPSICFFGSTYERDEINQEPNPNKAISILQKRLGPYISDWNDISFKGALAAVRLCGKNHYLPTIQKLTSKVFLFAGLGSRGLLYHGYYGEQLATMMRQEAIHAG